MKTEESKPEYEQVFTVTDYWDGPRQGIANYQGKPHFYERIFDEARDGYSDLFELTPIDSETLRLALEDWDIWQRWNTAFHAGQTNQSTHPALPHESRRHEELKQILDATLVTDPERAVTRLGTFSVLDDRTLPMGPSRRVQVSWSEPHSESPPERHVR